MTKDIETMKMWIHVAITVAAFCTSMVPILYSFSRWRSRILGQLFMFQAVSFALAVDITLMLTVWQPRSIKVDFWLQMISLMAISISTISLSIKMWLLNHPKKKDEGKHDSQ
jgi:hypothetical protein